MGLENPKTLQIRFHLIYHKVSPYDWANGKAYLEVLELKPQAPRRESWVPPPDPKRAMFAWPDLSRVATSRNSADAALVPMF